MAIERRAEWKDEAKCRDQKRFVSCNATKNAKSMRQGEVNVSVPDAYRRVPHSTIDTCPYLIASTLSKLNYLEFKVPRRSEGSVECVFLCSYLDFGMALGGGRMSIGG